MENQPGALSRVVGLFSQRGYNIDSLSVAPTNDSSLSRLTMVVKEEESVISQILKQLNKVIDVVEVQNLSDVESVSLEIAIVKLKITEKEAKKIIESAFPVVGEIINHKDAFVMIKPFFLSTRKPLPNLKPTFLSSINGLSTDTLNFTEYKLASSKYFSDNELE